MAFHAGHYRDLQESGVNYTKKELITRRCECLVWEADFEEKNAEHGIEAYLNSPLLDKLELNRKSSHLSSFFWRNTGFVPDEKDTGLHTVVKLAKILLEIAESAYGPLVKLSDLTQPEQQTQMHDYRKQLRGILYVGDVLPVWENTTETEAAVTVLTDAYDGLGKVEDAINAYVFEEEHGDKESQDEAKKELEGKWSELLKQLDEDGLVDAEKALVDSLIHY